MGVEGPEHQPNSTNRYAQIVAKTQNERRLFSVHWELTYRCNERCSHCYLDVLPPDGRATGELTNAECVRVLDELAALGVLHLTFSGGEILVRTDFFEIAEYARSNRFLLRLFTNGIAITPAIADRIASLHPYAVEISTYSTRAEIHERITRRPGSFALSIRALRLLRERGVRTVMKTPLMRENVREFHALESLAGDLGARYRYDITLTPKDNGNRAPLDHRLSDDDLLWLFRETLDPARWLDRKIFPGQRVCNIGRNALLIDPNGNVFPCVQLRRHVGNVCEKPLKELWETSPVWSEVDRLTLDELPVCRACEQQMFCVRCHGLAQLEDGELRGPASANCREALARRQVLSEKGALQDDFPGDAYLFTSARMFNLN